MESLSVEEKKVRLSKIIIDLSKTQDILENHDNVIKYFGFLEDIYYSENPNDIFRHYYSDIFGWISQIDNGYSEDAGNLEILSQNISVIKDEYEMSIYEENTYYVNKNGRNTMYINEMANYIKEKMRK